MSCLVSYKKKNQYIVMADESKLDGVFFEKSTEQTTDYLALLDQVRTNAPMITSANVELAKIRKDNKGTVISTDARTKILRFVVDSAPKNRRMNKSDTARNHQFAQRQRDAVARGMSGLRNMQEYPIYSKRPGNKPPKRACCDAIVFEVAIGGVTYGRQCRRTVSTTNDIVSPEGLCKQHQCTPGQRRYRTLPDDFRFIGNTDQQPEKKKTEIQTMFSDALVLLRTYNDDKNSITLIRKYIKDHSEKVQAAYQEHVRIGISQMIQTMDERDDIKKAVINEIEGIDADILTVPEMGLCTSD
jgi:hypothetical protein